MRIDTYTKFVLTLIAVALLMIGCKSALQPRDISAAGPDVTVLCASCSFRGAPTQPQSIIILWDKGTGDVWLYPDEAIAGTGKPIKWGRLTLGQAVARIQ
jgi:hypothetical protein